MSVTVAAIIPTHKRPELLARAISSVLNQSKPVDEVIVIDDASCDRTLNVVRSFKSNAVKYFRNPDVGASSSRNYGVQVASCDFVAFLDDDDEWAPDKIKLQMAMVEEQNLDLCFTRIQIVYEGTNIRYLTNARMSENLARDICIENCIGGTISSMIRRELFLSVQGFDLNFHAREEYDLWIRLIHAGARVGILEIGLSIAYRSLYNRKRISSDVKKYENAIALLNTKYKSLIEESLSHDQQSLRYRKQCEFLAAQAVSSGLRVAGFKYYVKYLQSRFNLKIAAMAMVCLVHPILLIRMRALSGWVKSSTRPPRRHQSCRNMDDESEGLVR